jgi:opacity protein-like surface antigen
MDRSRGGDTMVGTSVRAVFSIFVFAAVAVPSALADGMPSSSNPAPAYSWTGWYVGGHTGAAIDYSNFSNPYGATLYGDNVRSPGPFIGGQVGYNYQSGQLVYGVEATATWANLQGTATCMQPIRRVPGLPPQFAGGAFGGTCEVEPDAFGTIVAKGGYAFGSDDRMLAYGKGGLAWLHNDITMSANNSTAGVFGPGATTRESSFTQWGWTLGAGLEYALTSRWSVGVEYDYLHFGNHTVATPDAGPMTNPGFPGINGSSATDGRLASVNQDVHAAKLAVNYALGDRGGDPWRGLELSGANALSPAFASGWQAEFGGRYVYARTRFQKDLGRTGSPLPVNNSRLEWSGVGTNDYELFGRVDTPWNFMIKSIVGVGRGKQGHIRDEDWGVENAEPPTQIKPYTNTESSITSSLDYFTIDGGYDLLRTGTYRIAPYVGYSYFHYKMTDFGCLYLSYVPAQCEGPPTTGLQETDEWRSLRLGTAAELMLTSQLKLTADAAYLPYVAFQGVDNHLERAGEGASTRSPEHGAGTGVQIEGMLTYDLTQQFSIGAGARYWSMQVPQGLTNFFSGGNYIPQRFEVEQASVFAQGSYKFNAPD